MKKILCSLLFVPAMAHAYFLNGNDLLNELDSPETMDRIFAMGYISGVADAINTVTYCPPVGVQLSQLRDMARQYLTVNASIRDLPADALMKDMLSRRWPCKNQPKGKGV